MNANDLVDELKSDDKPKLRKVGDFCSLVNGSVFKESDWSKSGLPIIRIQNLNNAAKLYNYWNGSLDRLVRVKQGDILLAWSGTPGTSFGAHLWSGPQGLLNQHIFRIDLVDEGIFPQWLVFALNVKLSILIARAHGAVGLAHVTKKEVASIEIMVPPLGEQIRIADRMVQQLSIVDRAREAARLRLAAAEALPAAYLNEVFEGKEASEWQMKPLKDLCTTTGQYGTSLRSNDQQKGLPVLGMSHIHNGRIRWANLSYADLSQEDLLKYRLSKCDLLFNRTNSAELVGKTAVFDGARDAVFASYLIRFRLAPDRADPHFVATYINSKFGRQYIKNNMARAVGQVNISASVMAEMLIPCPRFERQYEITNTYLTPRMAEIDRMTASIKQEIAAIETIPAALLREAFAGSD